MKTLRKTISRLLSPVPVRAFIECRNAHRKGDFATAAKKLEPLVHEGDPHALNLLADMYNSGEGVEQNVPEAFRLYTRAAKAGNSEAQYNLGVLISDGDGVPQNDVISLMWFCLAEAQGHRAAAEEVEIMTSMMLPDEIEEAYEKAAKTTMAFERRASQSGQAFAVSNLKQWFGRHGIGALSG